MIRLLSTLSFAILAGCSQPASLADMKMTSSASHAQSGAQGVPGGDALARCQGANWRATGYRHGLSGYPLSALKDVSAACEGTGVKVDRLAYSTGRLEGLEKFCSMENGYRRAKAGQSSVNPCPPTLARQFEAGYARGMAER